jgi:hypothetical protein
MLYAGRTMFLDWKRSSQRLPSFLFSSSFAFDGIRCMHVCCTNSNYHNFPKRGNYPISNLCSGMEIVDQGLSFFGYLLVAATISKEQITALNSRRGSGLMAFFLLLGVYFFAFILLLLNSARGPLDL